jgi:integrase
MTQLRRLSASARAANPAGSVLLDGHRLGGNGAHPRGGRGLARHATPRFTPLFNYARAPQRRWAAVNPCDGVELPVVPNNDEIRFLDAPEWEAVLRHVQPGAFEALDRAFLPDRDHGRASPRRADRAPLAQRRLARGAHPGATELGAGRVRHAEVRATRSVPMADRLAGELDRLYTAMGEPGEDALVFADPITGTPLDKAANLRRYRKVLKAAALDATHNLHGLRHTFGTHCAAAGVAMRTLQEWMGHRHIATTQRYADYAPSAHEADLIAHAFAARDVVPVEVARSSYGDARVGV